MSHAAQEPMLQYGPRGENITRIISNTYKAISNPTILQDSVLYDSHFTHEYTEEHGGYGPKTPTASKRQSRFKLLLCSLASEKYKHGHCLRRKATKKPTTRKRNKNKASKLKMCIWTSIYLPFGQKKGHVHLLHSLAAFPVNLLTVWRKAGNAFTGTLLWRDLA